MGKSSHMDSLARILTEAESVIPKEKADKQVKVEHCINIKELLPEPVRKVG